MYKTQLVSLTILFAHLIPLTGFGGEPPGPVDNLTVSGFIRNAQGKGVREAAVRFFLNGRKTELEDEVVSYESGGNTAALTLPGRDVPGRPIGPGGQQGLV